MNCLKRSRSLPRLMLLLKKLQLMLLPNPPQTLPQIFPMTLNCRPKKVAFSKSLPMQI